MKMTRKYNYYHVDCGHFPVQIKLCFNNTDFQKILSDYDIKVKATALDEGIGETHYLSDGREGVVVVAFDLDNCDLGEAYLAGIIAHEATHVVCRVFEHIGEEPEEIGEESRAYLTEHIVKQLTHGISIEKEKNARKIDRAISGEKGKRKQGPVSKVDIDDNGSTGQNSVVEPTLSLRRAQNTKWRLVSSTKNSLQRARSAGFPCAGDQVKGGS